MFGEGPIATSHRYSLHWPFTIINNFFFSIFRPSLVCFPHELSKCDLQEWNRRCSSGFFFLIENVRVILPTTNPICQSRYPHVLNRKNDYNCEYTKMAITQISIRSMCVCVYSFRMIDSIEFLIECTWMSTKCFDHDQSCNPPFAQTFWLRISWVLVVFFFRCSHPNSKCEKKPSLNGWVYAKGERD